MNGKIKVVVLEGVHRRQTLILIANHVSVRVVSVVIACVYPVDEPFGFVANVAHTKKLVAGVADRAIIIGENIKARPVEPFSRQRGNISVQVVAIPALIERILYVGPIRQGVFQVSGRSNPVKSIVGIIIGKVFHQAQAKVLAPLH